MLHCSRIEVRWIAARRIIAMVADKQLGRSGSPRQFERHSPADRVFSVLQPNSAVAEPVPTACPRPTGIGASGSIYTSPEPSLKSCLTIGEPFAHHVPHGTGPGAKLAHRRATTGAAWTEGADEGDSTLDALARDFHASRRPLPFLAAPMSPGPLIGLKSLLTLNQRRHARIAILSMVACKLRAISVRVCSPVLVSAD